MLIFALQSCPKLVQIWFLVGPSSSPALAQLLPSSPPALSQLFPSSCPRCCARVARVVKTLSQTLPDSPRFSPDSPRLSQTLPDSQVLPDAPRLSQILPDSARFSYALPDSLHAPKFAQALTDSPKRCQTLPDSNALPVHATTGLDRGGSLREGSGFGVLRDTSPGGFSVFGVSLS